MKSLIVYKGKYGATKQYAQWLKNASGIPVLSAEICGEDELEEAQLLVMGSSVYIGKLKLATWIREHQLLIGNKRLVLFVVSGTPLSEEDKLDSYIKASVPAAIASHCHIFFLPGRLRYEKLSLRDRFMLRIGALFAGKTKSKQMLQGYDEVKEEHLTELKSCIAGMLNQSAETAATDTRAGINS